MTRLNWTPECIKQAKAILAKHTSVDAALPSIGKLVMHTAVTSDGIYSAFRRAGLGKPADFCTSVSADVKGVAVIPDGVAKLLKLTKKGPLSFEATCDGMGMSPKECRAFLKATADHGYAFTVEHDSVTFRLPGANDNVRIVQVAPTVGPRNRIGVISDTHLGSKYCLRAQLKEFISYAYSQGVREILHPGDVLDGCYRHGTYELTHSGIDDQTQDLFETLPQLPGLTYSAICGNHDDTFSDAIGMDAGLFMQRYFENRGRHDLKFYGRRGAHLRMHGATIELWHPKKSPGYSLSYGLQNHIRDMAVGHKPDVLLVGHWHVWCYLEQRGVHALAAGTFQGGGSAFGKSLGGAPSMGGTILSWELTKDGTLRRFQVERSAYYEQERVRVINPTKAAA